MAAELVRDMGRKLQAVEPKMPNLLNGRDGIGIGGAVWQVGKAS